MKNNLDIPALSAIAEWKKDKKDKKEEKNASVSQ